MYAIDVAVCLDPSAIRLHCVEWFYMSSLVSDRVYEKRKNGWGRGLSSTTYSILVRMCSLYDWI